MERVISYPTACVVFDVAGLTRTDVLKLLASFNRESQRALDDAMRPLVPGLPVNAAMIEDSRAIHMAARPHKPRK